jgi:hypothetical protein
MIATKNISTRATPTATEKPLTSSAARRSNFHIKHERATVQRAYRAKPCNRENRVITWRAKRGADLAVWVLFWDRRPLASTDSSRRYDFGDVRVATLTLLTLTALSG